MFRTLLVEDSPPKIADVLQVLGEIEGFDIAAVESVGNVMAALRKIKEQRYDLLIVDIALPLREGETADREAGIRLVEQVISGSDPDHVPRHIVGLTGYADIQALAAGRFTARLLSVLHYEPASSKWAVQIKARVRQLLLCHGRPKVESEVLAAIVCALEEPEFSELLATSPYWEPTFASDDHFVYWKTKPGTAKPIYAVSCPRMGLAAAAIVAERVLATFRPDYLIMTGIMAGISGRVELGDVIAADPCWDWGSGKWVEDHGVSRFLPAPHQVGLDVKTRERLKFLAQDQEFARQVWQQWAGTKPPQPPKLVIGPTASGASVIADERLVSEIVAQHRKVLGVEMEAYGVYVAAEESREPRPHRLVLKSAVDFADDKKSDDFQRYGSYVSARFALEFLARFSG